MRRYRAPSTALGTFFVVQSSADCTTNMSGFDLRQAHQGYVVPDAFTHGTSAQQTPLSPSEMART